MCINVYQINNSQTILIYFIFLFNSIYAVYVNTTLKNTIKYKTNNLPL